MKNNLIFCFSLFLIMLTAAKAQTISETDRLLYIKQAKENLPRAHRELEKLLDLPDTHPLNVPKTEGQYYIIPLYHLDSVKAFERKSIFEKEKIDFTLNYCKQNALILTSDAVLSLVSYCPTSYFNSGCEKGCQVSCLLGTRARERSLINFMISHPQYQVFGISGLDAYFLYGNGCFYLLETRRYTFKIYAIQTYWEYNVPYFLDGIPKKH